MKRSFIGILLVASVALAGIGAAVTVTDWDGTNDVSETFDVNNDTDTLRVLAENVTNDTAQVDVYGLDAGGNETLVTSTTISTDQANGTYTTSYDYSSINATKYDKYRVNVTGDGADTIEIVEIGVLNSGAGLLGGGGVPQKELYALGGLAVIGAALYLRRD